MYVGHVAVALALKARRPAVPMLPLVLACYGPDWLELPFMFPHAHGRMALFTHSIPAILTGATLAAVLFAMLARRPGAMTLFLGWALHWPADLFTGRKPLFDEAHLIGLDLYSRPRVDFLLESAVIALGCYAYGRAIAHSTSQRRVVAGLVVVLITLQAGMDFTFAWLNQHLSRFADGGSEAAASSCCAQGRPTPGGAACLLHSCQPPSQRASNGGWTEGRADVDLPDVRKGKVFYARRTGGGNL